MDIAKRIQNGEDSYTQFKRDITNADKLAQELVAFSNARGGVIIIGVEDDGRVVGLEAEDVRRLNQLIGSVTHTHVVPPIYPLVKVESIENQKVLIVEVSEGVNKPYATNGGVYLTKAGSDKRKISPQELKRLFAESGNLYPDEELLFDSTIADVDMFRVKKFLKNDNKEILDKLNSGELELQNVLGNLEIFKEGHLTLAGNLLFGEHPQKFCPSFYIDCCYFDGYDISVTKFISKQTMKGTFEEMYDDSVRFVMSQLRHYQVENDFNSQPKQEISQEVISELIINALVHRDYYIQASIKIFMFHDRVEIISPGKLVNSLDVEKIKNGIAIHRNPILSSLSKNILPYSGYGSGIKRVLRIDPTVELINDTWLEQFKCIIHRSVKPLYNTPYP